MTDSVRLRRVSWHTFALLGLAFSVWPEGAKSAAAEEVTVAEPAARYPFDPVCPWGRVADGRGLLVRCLEPSEARRLVLSAPAPQSVVPSTSAAGAAAPPNALVAPHAQAQKSGRRVVVKEVGPAIADTGALPEAQRQLRLPADRYAACVESNGGLEADTGEVTLRFLVRERGRAEGVAVKERRGVSVLAAKCIASVVDRRYVGYPAAPIVGASLTINLGLDRAAR